MTRRIILLFLIGFVIGSCGSSKRTTRKVTPEEQRDREVNPKSEKEVSEKEVSEEEKVVNPVPKTGVDGYIETYVAIAQEEMRQYGIPASITLAQGILESGAGKGVLVKTANNHFGIKCHDWKGARVYHDDDEKGECFRKYSLAKFSYRDHSLFLANRGRYSSLFKLPKDDYRGWAKGLKAAGYATDKKYPSKLISIIERYKLYRFDGEVLGKNEKDYKKVKDKKNQHTVEKGETLYRIAKKFKVSVEDLKKFNGLEGNEIFVGQVLYVEPFDRGH